MDRLAGVATSIASDPVEAARIAAEVADEALAAGDWECVSRARAVRGRALRMLGEIALAGQALEGAVEAARTADDEELEADAQLALGGVLSAMGRHDEAFAALDVAGRVGSPVVRERAVLQRAVVCRDVRRLDEALGLFDASLPALREPGRELDLARAQANRGGILLLQGDPFGAMTAFEEAVALLRGSGQDFIVFQVLHDLGCVVAHLGDLPRALDLFDQASSGMAGLGHDASLPLLSRAEALLRAGLSSDALAAATDAARRLAAEGNRFAAAQSLVALAEASRLEGDDEGALVAAARASADFAAGGARGWAYAASLVGLRTRLQLGRTDRDDLEHVLDIAAGLAETGDLRSEVSARCIAAVAAASLGEPAVATAQIEAAHTLAERSRLIEFDVALLHARARLALVRGDEEAARAHLLAALDAVETANAVFGGTAANAALATEGREVADAAMTMASIEPDPWRSLDWTERVRAVTAKTPPVLAGNDAARTFARLRAVTGELRRAERDGGPTDELRRAQAGIERHLRDVWLRQRSSPATTAGRRFDPAALAATCADSTVVSIGLSRRASVAVVVDRRGARRVDLAAPAEVGAIAARVATAFRSTRAAGAPAIVEARRQAFVAALRSLDAAVLEPLELDADADEIVLVLPPALVALPWAATPTLVRRRFSIAPSVAWWQDAAASPVRAGHAALVVAGPRLAATASTEAKGVASCHPDATLLSGSAATVAATIEALGRHDIAHIVAHGHFRNDNPLWSTIELADGAMSLHELRQLDRVPATIVVATCESAISGLRETTEFQGLAATLLDLGARTVVASVGALPDDAVTSDTMVAVHRDLRHGIGPAQSLARARSVHTADTIDPTAAGLVTIGLAT